MTRVFVPRPRWNNRRALDCWCAAKPYYHSAAAEPSGGTIGRSEPPHLAPRKARACEEAGSHWSDTC